MKKSSSSVFLLLVSSLLFPVFLISGCASSVSSVEQNLERRAVQSNTEIANQSSSVTVYLVRHAEKQLDGTGDPALTLAGVARAEALADILSGVDFDQIHSTDYQRTRNTALPTAQRKGLEALSFYAGNDLEEVAGKILAVGGVHLVVGHSNTTNEVAHFLSGIKGPAISDNEYDRLYIVTKKGQEDATLSIVRFGPGF